MVDFADATSLPNSIVERLKEIGWAEEISKMNSSSGLFVHPLVNHEEELTTQSRCSALGSHIQLTQKADWNKIKPTLVALLKEDRKDRLQKEKNSNVRNRAPLLEIIREEYVRHCPVNTIVPPPASLFHFFKPFRDVIENSPSGENFTTEHFRDAIEQLPKLIPPWIKKQSLKFLKDMTSYLHPKNKLEASDLDLATTLFRCRGHLCSCQKLLSYPEALVRYDHSSSVTVMKDILDLDKKRISFNAGYHATATKLVELAGLDPFSTTAFKMDELDPIFVCTSELCSFSGKLCMTWRRAVSTLLNNSEL